MTSAQLQTFQAVSGVAPDHLALIIRMIVGGILLMWALWMTTNFMHHLRKEKGSAVEVIAKSFRVCLVLMVGLILIAYR